MPRPENEKLVHIPPLFSDFKPAGAATRYLERVELSIDEYEALRLADFIGLSHEAAAEEMETSRSTFSRIIERARKKLTDFIINGKILTIDGGNIHFRRNLIQCSGCGYMFKTKIDDHFDECPECASSDLVNLAGGYGHGKCCVERNYMKGE